MAVLSVRKQKGVTAIRILGDFLCILPTDQNAKLMPGYGFVAAVRLGVHKNIPVSGDISRGFIKDTGARLDNWLGQNFKY